jgi:hypothetical protein
VPGIPTGARCRGVHVVYLHATDRRPSP